MIKNKSESLIFGNHCLKYLYQELKVLQCLPMVIDFEITVEQNRKTVRNVVKINLCKSNPKCC